MEAGSAGALSGDRAPAAASRYGLLLAAYALLIAYASLYPFAPLRFPGSDAFAAIWSPRYVSRFDIAVNVLAYVPLGLLACLVFRRPGTGAASAIAIAKATAAACAFSVAMESCQLFVAWRFASFSDVLANTAGALAGALAFAEPAHSLLTRRIGRWRERFVIPGAWGDAGLMIAALWLLPQLNPALPFFALGDIATAVEDSLAARVLPFAAAGLSVCGFGLFVSVVLKGPVGALRHTLLLLTLALWFKFASAAMLLKPQLAADWVSAERVLGLAVGLAAFAPLRRLGRPARTYLAALFLLAGALLAKVYGEYSALGEVLRLFNRPYGQLANFNSLTRLLQEIGPFVTLAFLVGLFLRERGTPHAIIARDSP